MIPRKIHYCWFGRNPLPESAKKCIASWRKFFPDYEIIEWNEDNFDVNSIPYTAQAYEAKKYAFVSDYARFKILYEHGGVYFDTDVEVIRPMDDIIARGPFMGFEIDPCKNIKYGAVNPGLGIGAEKQMDIYESVLEYYSHLHFLEADGTLNQTTVVSYTTENLIKYGLQSNAVIQTVAGVTVYPSEYFNPLDDLTGKLKLTDNTRSIHWFSKTWLGVSPWRTQISRLSHRILGTNFISRIKSIIRK